MKTGETSRLSGIDQEMNMNIQFYLRLSMNFSGSTQIHTQNCD